MTAVDGRGSTARNARRSCSTPARRSRRRTRSTVRRRSPGQHGTICRTWSSCCSAAEPPPICRTTNHGPHHSPGRSNVDMCASWRSSERPVPRRETVGFNMTPGICFSHEFKRSRVQELNGLHKIPLVLLTSCKRLLRTGNQEFRSYMTYAKHLLIS